MIISILLGSTKNKEIKYFSQAQQSFMIQLLDFGFSFALSSKASCWCLIISFFFVTTDFGMLLPFEASLIKLLLFLFYFIGLELKTYVVSNGSLISFCTVSLIFDFPLIILLTYYNQGEIYSKIIDL